MTAQAFSAWASCRETVACRICASARFTPYLEARGFTIVQCSACGLRYVNPQPSIAELQQIYTVFDQGSQWRSGEEHFNLGVRSAILRFKKMGSVLDIGSGAGNFLRCMRQAGFSIYGVEPSRAGSAYAVSEHKIKTFNGTIEAFLSSARHRQFDVVTMLNVLEHLKDPAAVLCQTRTLLHEEGILVVVVPDARFHAVIGQTRRRLGVPDPFWMNTERHPLVGFDPPHHLYSFEPRTIVRLLEHCGLRVLRVQNAPVIFNEDRWKNVAKVILRAFSEVLHRLTRGHLVLGYSTLVIAQEQ